MMERGERSDGREGSKGSSTATGGGSDPAPPTCQPAAWLAPLPPPPRKACLGVHVEPVVNEGQGETGEEERKVGVPPPPPVQLQRLQGGWSRAGVGRWWAISLY